MANRKKTIQMDYQQCAEHSGTADGAQPLKNPELVRKSSKDVNRGLYPRSSSKKGKNMQCEFGSNSKPLIASEDIGVSVANSLYDSNTHAGYSDSINQIGTVDYSCQMNSHLEGMPVKQGQNSSVISCTKCSFDSYEGDTSRQLYANQNPTFASNFISEIDSKRMVSCQKRKDLGNCECLPEVEQNKTYMHECSVPRFNNSSQSLQNSRTSSDQSLYASELSSPKRKLPDDFLSLAKFKIISPLNSSKAIFSSNNLTSERDYASKPNAQTSSEDAQSPASDSNMIRMTDSQASKSGCRSGEDNCLLKSVRRNLINKQSGIKLSSEVTTDDPNLLAFEDSSDDDLMIHASQEAEKRCATSSPVMDSNLEAFEDDSFLDNLSPTMLDNMEKENYVANTSFGLLGSSQIDDDADEPEEDEEQGYFTCLPDEVLQMIFSYLSINVCCNICGVCKRWSRIILNQKFLPWKKLYQRYKISEESGVSAVEAIYTTHSFGDAESCLLKLIRYMSEFKTLDKSSTVAYMDRHPMFQLSCDLLAERAPDLVMQGVPNLWSLLATLVILSRNTQDISQAIKYSLQSPCEHSALIESFYCIATMLLMLQYKHGINCGLHYRLYHALYHYETGSSLAYSTSRIAIQLSSSKDSLMMQNSEHVMTQEQVAIVSYKLTPREIVKIIAFAGTGKTSTLINYTLRNPTMQFLYVAFNKSVEEYAKRNFPYNVECRTTHSLAFRDVGFRYKKKLGNLNVYNVVCLLEPKAVDWQVRNMPLYVRAKLVMKTVNNFIASDDDHIMLLHVPEKEREEGHTGQSRQINPQRRKDLLMDARKLWERMRNPSDREATLTHDGYLKLYQLKKPKLPAVDCILIDEAQDLTPAQQAILLHQDCAKILVGDPHQQIYSFRGATNALQNIPATKIFHLTQSFRFGPEIAYVANCVLQAFKDLKGKNVIGVEELGSVLGEEVGQIAIICRTNLSLFNEAAKLCEQNQTVRIGLVGGVRSYRFDQIMDIYRLYLPKFERRKPENEIQNKFIRRFSSIAQLQNFAESVDDIELLGRIHIVTHHIKIPEHIERIKSRAVDDISQAEVVFSTAHKAKGLEFDTVKVTCDFLTDTNECDLVGFDGAQHHVQVQVNQKPPEDELNLLYVALTRAKKRLKLTSPILKMLTKLNEKFAYPVSTQAIIRNAEGALVKCWQCYSEIDSKKVLVFERLNIDLGYSLQASRPAGFMCSSCAGAENLGFSSLV